MFHVNNSYNDDLNFQVLIEKLLFTCKAVDQIYVLIRKKKSESPLERIAQMLQSEVGLSYE